MSKTLTPITANAGLVDRAVAHIRERILRGDYPEELPSQEQLCTLLGVSRTVVREALQQLQSQRLVAITQGRRVRVLPLDAAPLVDGLSLILERSPATLFDLAEVRLLLETEIAARAAVNASEGDIELLDRLIRLMEESTSREQQVRLDIDFHSTLATASGNIVYRYLLDSLASLLRESRLKTIGLGGIGPAVTGHRRILGAVQARDPEAARRAMREHLEASVQDLKKASKPQGGKP